MATYDITQSVPDPSVLKAGDILICPYSGAIKYCILPKGTYKLETWGACGGHWSGRSSGKYGKGGYCTGKIVLTDLTTYYCITGGAGNTNSAGYNGGGSANGRYGNGGGGASHIATISSLLSSRSGDYRSTVLLIAAGGGGSSLNLATSGSNGDGGGLEGTNGAYYSQSAMKGTQTAGGIGGAGYQNVCPGGSGSFGRGGNGGAPQAANYGGGGGGGGAGLYGGGGGGGANSGNVPGRSDGGGGGSSYYNTSLLTEYSTIAGNASMPSPSGDTETGHDDNGYIKITIIEIEVSIPLLVNIAGTYKQVINAYVNVNGAWKDVTDIKTNVGGTWK